MLTLVPAYGTDYTTAKQVKEAWKDGKDFRICSLFSPDDGRYINLQDAVQGGITEVMIRFCDLRKITRVPIPR